MIQQLKLCRNADSNKQKVVTVGDDFSIEFLDDQVRAKIEATEIVGGCHKQAKLSLEQAGTNLTKIQNSMDFLLKCVEGEVTETLSKANEEVNFQAKIRTGMAEMMENYTCVDTDLDTSESLRTEYWRGSRDRRNRQVEILLDRPASKIILVKNFISQRECEAMEVAAQSKLHQASVADGKGGSHFSEHRKAMQAGITVNWEKEMSGDKIAALSRRVYDYTNHVLDLDIQEHGQEDLMSIQYSGRGLDDKEPDRYTPHCDG